MPINELEPKNFPPLLKEIPDKPKKLYYRGKLPNWQDENLKFLAVVGSRKTTSYGRAACEMLLGGLSGYPIVIISGLALGIDALAHEIALKSGLTTIAIPGSGLADKALYPRTNFSLAQKILGSGGALLSEFEPEFKATIWGFPQRNRIMAGLAHATLVVEGEERSGSLITARLTSEYNRELLVVPGPITSSSSRGPHLFMRLGATPIRDSTDILEALKIEKEDRLEPAELQNISADEKKMLRALNESKTKDELSEELDMEIFTVSAILSMLELRGLVKESDGTFGKTGLA